MERHEVKKQITYKKRIITTSVIALIIAALFLYLYFPRSLYIEEYYEKASYVMITHRKVYPVFEGNVTLPSSETYEIRFTNGTPEYKEIIDILKGFSFHKTISSLFYNSFSGLSSGGEDISIDFFLSDGEKMSLFIIDTNGRNLSMNNRYYEIGFFGSDEITRLFSEIMEVTNRTHYNLNE
ncbi:MAG: hypothetical protein FWG31_02575 [Oscillospiraceae bacterium]|nr:hypothetical protein [Oscillospiraceae bacterium]